MIKQANTRVPISEDWLIEQQRRAEAEADVWRRLREHIVVDHNTASPSPAVSSEPTLSAERTSAHQQKVERLAFAHALVQLGFCLIGAFLASFVVMLSGGGILEEWFAGSAGFALCVGLLILFQRRPLHARIAQASVIAVMAASAVAASQMWPI
jgi:hypothetical protein